MKRSLHRLPLALIASLITTPVCAESWTLMPEASTLSFTGTQTGTSFEGAFNQFEADITFDANTLSESNIQITIHTGSVETGSADRDTTLPGADWFDTTNHPTATFASTDVVATDAGYQANGTLTIKGTTKEVALPFTVTIEGNIAHATGGLTINRNDFGVGTGSLSAMAGNDVTIYLDIKASH
ncbi:MAG: YceI family protein [Parvibaculum sp.]